ncbi:dihydroneopterin aldolase [Piscinibacter sp. Jin2]|uniref:Dihydroneopterin aldolase n=1 Tax=Aquariibacter lacus TaxID=2801332 RepID=A0A9X0XFI5_9BURK|nr:dihydroneopterin aldolase [Piscinibacter lacus]MBL0720789.1 dihydroneopterin aldolase [Piscinibacter lacus]
MSAAGSPPPIHSGNAAVASWARDPRLAGCRRLFLCEHVRAVEIGIHDFEQHAPQRLVFHVDLFVPLAASTPQADRIDEVVDYDFIRAVIAERIAAGRIGLQETLCDDIARRLLAHPQVRAVALSTAKPDVYADSRAVGVEVMLFKDAA